MAISSVGFAGSIGWAQWAVMAAQVGTDYAALSGLDLSVISAGSRVVAIGPGSAHARGVTVTLDAPEQVTMEATAGWWTVALRRDWTPGPGAETAHVVALHGGQAQAVAASRATQPGQIDDQPLWLVQVTATGAIGQTIDLRCWWGNGALRAATVDALAYLETPGSAVWVGQTLWRLDSTGAWVAAGGDRIVSGTVQARVGNRGIVVAASDGVDRPLPFAVYTARRNVTIPSGTARLNVVVNFPTGRFTAAPTVTVGINELSGGNLLTHAIATGASATRVTIALVRDGTTSGTQSATFSLIAVENQAAAG